MAGASVDMYGYGYDFEVGHAPVTPAGPASSGLHNHSAGYYFGEDERRLMQTVREQEEQFERLTRELEAERQSVVHQLEKFRLVNSATTSASSLTSGTDVSYRTKTGQQTSKDHGTSAANPDQRSDRDISAYRTPNRDAPSPYSGGIGSGSGHAPYREQNGSGPWKASQTSLSHRQQQQPEAQHPWTTNANGHRRASRADSTGSHDYPATWQAERAEPAAESHGSDFFITSQDVQAHYNGNESESAANHSWDSIATGHHFNGGISSGGYGSTQGLNATGPPYSDTHKNSGTANRDYTNLRTSRDFEHEPNSSSLRRSGTDRILSDGEWGSQHENASSYSVARQLSDAHGQPRLPDQWDRASNSGSTSHGHALHGHGNYGSLDGMAGFRSSHQQLHSSSGAQYSDGNTLGPNQAEWPASAFDSEYPEGEQRDQGAWPSGSFSGAMPLQRLDEEWQPWSHDIPAAGTLTSQRHLDYQDSQLYADDALYSQQARPLSVAGSDAFGPPGYGPAVPTVAGQPAFLPGSRQTHQFFGSRQSLASQTRDQRSVSGPEMTDIVECLEHPSNVIKANAAAYLQHICFRNNSVKAKMRALGAIPALVKMLDNPAPEMQRHACGCLLNLSHGPENAEGKKEIMRCTGLEKLTRLLRTSADNDVRELVTGILWNMSSSKDLKRPMIDSSLTIIANEIIIPHSGLQRQDGNDRPGSAALSWPAVFRNASGVIRNISSDGYYARKRLREFPGLVQSLIHLVKAAIGKNDIDNKSVENSVCVLRNLSYRLMEVDYPDHYDDDNPSRPRRQSAPAMAELLPGCFSSNSRKASSNVEKTPYQSRTTAGAGRGELLWQPDLVNIYLPLLADCSNPDTLEAAAGAVQNLAACEWQPSVDFREKVRKEKGLPIIVELLGLDADNVVCAAAVALRNLSLDQRNKELIGKYAIQQLISRLPPPSGSEPQFRISEATMRAVMATLHEVIKDTVDHAGSLAGDGEGIIKLMTMAKSRNKYESKTLRCAHQLLATLWGFNELHVPYKSRGWKESDFISKTMHPRSSAASPVPSSAASTLTRSHHHVSVISVNDAAATAGAGNAYPSDTLGTASVRGTSLSQSNPGFYADDEDATGDNLRAGDHRWGQENDVSKQGHHDSSYSNYPVEAPDKKSPGSHVASNDYAVYPAYRGSSPALLAPQVSPPARSDNGLHRAAAAMAIEDEPLYARLAKRGEPQQAPFSAGLHGDAQLVYLHDYPQHLSRLSSSSINEVHDFARGSLVQLQDTIDNEAKQAAAIDSWV